MVPGVIERIAGHPGWQPLLIHVVPDIPLMATGDAALVPPDK